MSTLAEIPDFVGFFSYSRRDDEHSEGALSRLRARIHSELGLQLGADFRLWQDVSAIPEGALWESEIERAIAESIFFVPIVTPSAISSKHCRFEFEAFAKRAARLRRTNLIFPILYVRVPALELKGEQWRHDEVLTIIAQRQYLDWQKYRLRGLTEPEVAERISQFCGHIVEALRQPWTPPEQRGTEKKPSRLKDAARQLTRRRRLSELAGEARRAAVSEVRHGVWDLQSQQRQGRHDEVSQLAGPGVAAEGASLHGPPGTDSGLQANEQRRGQSAAEGEAVEEALDTGRQPQSDDQQQRREDEAVRLANEGRSTVENEPHYAGELQRQHNEKQGGRTRPPNLPTRASARQICSIRQMRSRDGGTSLKQIDSIRLMGKGGTTPLDLPMRADIPRSAKLSTSRSLGTRNNRQARTILICALRKDTGNCRNRSPTG
jgi:hypothetical protein